MALAPSFAAQEEHGDHDGKSERHDQQEACEEAPPFDERAVGVGDGARGGLRGPIRCGVAPEIAFGNGEFLVGGCRATALGPLCRILAPVFV